ncbi:MAG: hypothetical protein WA055_00635 [Candidatus Moraniibacteriota bacterium]
MLFFVIIIIIFLAMDDDETITSKQAQPQKIPTEATSVEALPKIKNGITVD